MAVKIVAENIWKTFPTPKGEIHAIKNFNLTVEEGRFVSIVGPSGCGKSTFLRILAGLIPATSGNLKIMPGDDPSKPLNSVVFQEYAIFPWKTVLDNVAFGLEMRGISKNDRYDVARRWIEMVGLKKFTDAYPHQISGGMKQRVSIARALANDPEVLLMDEPLGALDAQTRNVLQEELLKLWESTRKTVIYITHSIEEAVLLSDEIILMTAHPGTNKISFKVDIPRPRDLKTTGTAEFASLNYAIWEALRDEVMAAMESQQ
jgi:NitT/TauT family transport system ATP-binding protein